MLNELSSLRGNYFDQFLVGDAKLLRHTQEESPLVLGKMIVLDPESASAVETVETGLTPTDLVFDEKFIYVSNFDDDTVSRIKKKSGKVRTLKTGRKPFKMATLSK